MNNEQKIISALRRIPRLDDDELSTATGIKPRQSVNQLCRWLESRGIVRREKGSRGKIVNYLLEPGSATAAASQKLPASLVTFVPSEPRVEQRKGPKQGSANTFDCDPAKTLFVFPCSGAKVSAHGIESKGPTILDEVTSELAQQLAAARATVRVRANVDESSMQPAWQRYSGSLYQAAQSAMKKAVDDGVHMVIVSGGYGLILATEPIGYYEAIFRGSWWPSQVLERVMAEYVSRHRLTTVRALASATTEYAKFLRRVDWRTAGVQDGWLLTPKETTGAMLKSPRTQGEALALLLRGQLNAAWTSSDGLRLTGHKLSS